MKSVKARFLKVKDKNPNLGSVICLARAIRNQSFNHKSIYNAFKKLVEEGDYSKKDKKEILKFLFSITIIEEGKKEIFVYDRSVRNREVDKGVVESSSDLNMAE